MPIFPIYFQGEVNVSAQIGDIAYCLSDEPDTQGLFETDNGLTIQYIGPITDVGVDVTNGPFIKVNCAVTPTGIGPLQSDPFIMFRKERSTNVSGLKGYYAEINFVNNSTEKAELFAVSSEVVQSSK